MQKRGRKCQARIGLRILLRKIQYDLGNLRRMHKQTVGKCMMITQRSWSLTEAAESMSIPENCQQQML